MSYAFVSYAVVIGAVLAYAAVLLRARRRLAAELENRSRSNRG